MLSFKSKLLESMPEKPSFSHGKKLRRLLILLLLGVIIISVILISNLQLLPKSGAGYYLYWVHDQVFLPIKGFTFDRFYPYSLVFWGPLCCLLILWAISFLMPRPILQRLQTLLARKAVYRPILHPFLVRAARWSRKIGIKPTLLTTVVHHERETALHTLASQAMETPHRRGLAQISRLTRLQVQLLTLPPVDTGSHLEAAVYWLETFTCLFPRREAHPDLKWLQRLMHRLSSQAETIISPLLDFREPAVVHKAKKNPGGFELTGLSLDLLYLAALGSDSTAKWVMDSGDKVQESIRRLAVSTMRRRRLLNRGRGRLEDLSGRIHDDFSLPSRPGALPYLGRLGLLLSLNLAYLARVPDIALGFMESIEALDFVLHQWPEEYITSLPSRGKNKKAPQLTGPQKLALLIKGLPRAFHYSICAQLKEKQTRKQRETWKQTTAAREGLVLPGDIEAQEDRYRSLYLASLGLD